MKLNEATRRVVVPFTTAPSPLYNCPPPSLTRAYAIGSSQAGGQQWAVNLDIPHQRPAAF